MASNYTFTNANLNSAEYRLNQRPVVITTEQKIANLRRWLADRPEQSWRESYKSVARELAMLEAE